jgi:hypothetical protein
VLTFFFLFRRFLKKSGMVPISINIREPHLGWIQKIVLFCRIQILDDKNLSCLDTWTLCTQILFDWSLMSSGRTRLLQRWRKRRQHWHKQLASVPTIPPLEVRLF